MLSTQRRKYDQATLEKAICMINNKTISLSQASSQFNKPKGTLYNKIHGITPLVCKKGPPTLLSQAEETKIAKWIVNMAKVGYPVHTTDVKETVAQLFQIKGSQLRPGKKWMKLFLQRHPEITKRHAEILSKSRAIVTEPAIRKWFEELNIFLQEENATDLLEDPRRIFNLDETGVQLCPKSGIVLAPKNYRALYSIASGQEKQSITVLCNFSASGEIVLPFIVYPLQRLSKDIANSVPDNWGIGRSESGWMTGQTFLEYVKEIFMPWLQSNNVVLPVLLLVDGHKSHINVELHDFCVENKIILYCLHPNTTHILQPCDVGIFGPLKAAWKNTVRQHSIKNDTQITRANFATLFAQCFETSMKKQVIINAFKACGIYPFNPDAIDYSKCILNRHLAIENEISLDEYKTTVDVIEKSILKPVLAKYTKCRKQNKALNSSLFKFWNKCKNKIENIGHSQSSYIDDSAKNSIDNVDIANNQVLTDNQNLELGQLSEDVYTIGTNTLIDFMDIENLPIEFSVEEVLNSHNEVINKVVQLDTVQLLDPQQEVIMTNDEAPVSWSTSQLQSTSTPISSKPIPLPWYTEDCSRDGNIPMNSLLNESHQEVIMTSGNFQEKRKSIEELLSLPSGSQKQGTKRRLTKSPVPLAITSKKFKEYLNQKENEKQKKAAEVIKRKIDREKKKAEKENNKKTKKHTSIKKLNTNKANKQELTQLDIRVGNYIVIEFETNKRNRYYVGQIQKCGNNNVTVKCMRKKASKFDDLTYFVEPSTDDVTEVATSSIKHVLPSPTIGRRGMITFENALYDLNLCE